LWESPQCEATPQWIMLRLSHKDIAPDEVPRSSHVTLLGRVTKY
jgi:hypothetical protein